MYLKTILGVNFAGIQASVGLQYSCSLLYKLNNLKSSTSLEKSPRAKEWESEEHRECSLAAEHKEQKHLHGDL